MIKTQELADPKSCLSKARDDELIFVLLARDPAAAFAIEMWVNERIRLGLNHSNDAQVAEALACALRMRCQRAEVIDA